MQKQKEKGYYIKIIFQAKGPNIIFEVRNNVEINKKEYVRIHDKLARSRKYRASRRPSSRCSILPRGLA